MKGQYLTVEYVLFFAMGVMIVILVYGLFNDTNKIIEESITETQLKNVGTLITGAIINVFEGSNSTNSTIYYNLTIPTKVSDCVYSIIIAIKKMRLECTENRENNAELDLYNFNITAKNILYSTRGFLGILSKNGMVEIL